MGWACYGQFIRYYGPLPQGTYEVSHLISRQLMPGDIVEGNSCSLTGVYRDITANSDWTTISIAFHAMADYQLDTNAILLACRTAFLQTIILLV